jgi:ech hydrogenase subunit A
MIESLVGVSVLLPVIAAILCLVAKNHRVRARIIVTAGIVLAISSLLIMHNGPFFYTPESILGINLNTLITIADFALLFIILAIAFKLGNPLIILLTLLLHINRESL